MAKTRFFTGILAAALVFGWAVGFTGCDFVKDFISGEPDDLEKEGGDKGKPSVEVTADGAVYKTTTTELTLSLSGQGVGGHTKDDIELTGVGVATTVTGGNLARESDTLYRLAVSGITKEEKINVTINGIGGNPVQVTVHHGIDGLVVVSPIAFSNGNDEWGSAIDLIKGAANGSALYVQLTGGTEKVNLAEGDGGLVLAAGASPGIVIIDGGGRTVDLTGTMPGSLISVDAGVTLVVRNITLKGLKSGDDGDTVDNVTSVINVSGSGANLVIEDGALITGNSGGMKHGAAGVLVGNGAVCEMTGGEISGNTNSYYHASYGSAGGVLVAWQDASFTISGGTIKNNANQRGNVVEWDTGSYVYRGGEVE